MMTQPAFARMDAAGEMFARACYETLGLWESGLGIWFEYLSDLSRAASPEGLLDANSRFLANCMQAAGRAAGELQRDGGLAAPTLADT